MRSSIAQGLEDAMARAERILIVGGGIGGLSVAAALHACGFAPELIERSDAWRAVGAGIAIQPNGIRVLRTFGVGTAVERAGTVIAAGISAMSRARYSPRPTSPRCGTTLARS
jgi:2-polyprenyl-6-methoxyphenol hydroxylase-like FAD-dependent oxidoreductase